MGLKIFRISAFLLFLLISSVKNYCQLSFPAENKNWKWLTSQDNTIYSLAVEGDTIWAGSDVGFFRVNKVTGESIKFNRINSPLPDNWILAIEVDKKNCKWIGTYQGGVVKIIGGEWKVFPPGYFGMYGMDIRDMKIEDNYLWIATWGQGLIRFNTLDNSFQIFNQTNSGLLYDAIYDIEIDSYGNKWFSTMLGLCRYNEKSWTTISSSGEDFKNTITAISIDKNDRLWALSGNSILAYYESNEWTNFTIPDTLFKCGLIELSCIYADKSGGVLVGSFGGLLRFDGKTWTVPDNDRDGFKAGIVECIRASNDGRIWIGSWNGLFFSDNDKLKIYHTGNTSISGNLIYSIQIDLNNNIWVGTDRGFAIFHNKKWDVYTKENSKLPGNNVKCISVDQKNNKWIATNSGLAVYCELNNTWQVYDTTNSGLPDDRISDLVFSEDNVLWLGTKKGLTSFDGTNWVNYDSQNSDLPLRGVKKIAIDQNNNLWLVSSNFDLKNRGDKIVKFDRSRFVIIEPPPEFGKLNKAEVYGISVDNNNIKWFTTSDNIISYNDKEWKYADRNTLQTIFSCLGDIFCTNDMIYICSTMAGLLRYDGSKFMSWNSTNSYIPDNIDSVNKDRYGNLWIGTEGKGIILYNPEGIVNE